ncbi:hypothetical protein PR048_003492 [Dryococelus australis]|uniref:Uncharacterized protein n=1 Tax=Dryococelus australis TaxID=614101 RepID=A0ABQ9INQ6_9NEOP|nr:hypothetical protein PR048_003492 [Dryococelus australis]
MGQQLERHILKNNTVVCLKRERETSYEKLSQRERSRSVLEIDSLGAAVAERLARSPPTKANRVESLAGSLRVIAFGNRAGRCRWSAGFLSGISREPPPFHSGDAPYSPRFAVIGSQDLDVKSRPNLFTFYLLVTSYVTPRNGSATAVCKRLSIGRWHEKYDTKRSSPSVVCLRNLRSRQVRPKFVGVSVLEAQSRLKESFMKRANSNIRCCVEFKDSGAGMKGRGKRKVPQKTRQPASSSGTIPTREHILIPGGVAPGFSQVGIVPDDVASRRVFSGISPQALFYTRSHSTLTGSQDLDFKSRPNLSTAL